MNRELLADWRAADRVPCPVCGAPAGHPCTRVIKASGIRQSARGPVHHSTGRLAVEMQPHAQRIILGVMSHFSCEE